MGGGGGGGGGGEAVGWRGGRGRGPPPRQQGGMGERCKLQKLSHFPLQTTLKISVFAAQ